jgi:hypothetical protein
MHPTVNGEKQLDEDRGQENEACAFEFSLPNLALFFSPFFLYFPLSCCPMFICNITLNQGRNSSIGLSLLTQHF